MQSGIVVDLHHHEIKSYITIPLIASKLYQDFHTSPPGAFRVASPGDFSHNRLQRVARQRPRIPATSDGFRAGYLWRASVTLMPTNLRYSWENTVGLISAQIELSNLRDKNIKPLQVRALVDTGSLHLCIPEHVAIQLDLEELYKREVTTADGKKRLVLYMGPVSIKFENRGCFTGALVLGDEVLLGAVPMEDMDVLISPAKQALIVNPESPNVAMSIAK